MTKSVFSSITAEILKEEGMSLAANNEKELLRFARDIAFCMGAKGPITADDVQEELMHLTGRQLKGGAGSLFREGKMWEFTGEFKKSRRAANHGHCYRVWKLKE